MARSLEKQFARRVSDEELEYYGELFLGRGIREAGVDFETFLSNPDYFLLKYPRKRGSGEADDAPHRRKGLMERFGWRSVSRTSE